MLSEWGYCWWHSQKGRLSGHKNVNISFGFLWLSLNWRISTLNCFLGAALWKVWTVLPSKTLQKFKNHRSVLCLHLWRSIWHFSLIRKFVREIEQTVFGSQHSIWEQRDKRDVNFVLSLEVYMVIEMTFWAALSWFISVYYK